MNKLIGEGPKGKVLMLVLEPGNIARLKEGRPIEFSLNDEGLWPRGLPAKLNIVIHYSETPIADARKFKEMAEHTIDTRTPKIEKMRPHCPECKSSIEQLMIWRQAPAPWLICCSTCGCVLGATPPVPGLEKEAAK